MLRPTSSGAMRRRVVSTSGSSGMAPLEPVRSEAQLRHGSTRIFACASGFASVRNASPTPSTPVRARDHRRHVDHALGERRERARELVGRVAEHELHVQLLVDAETRADRVVFHADARDHDARLRRRLAHHLVENARHADALEEHGALRAGDFAPRIDRSLLVRVDDDLRAHVGRQLASHRRVVGGDDGLDAGHPQAGDHRETDGTAADDERGVALGDAGPSRPRARRRPSARWSRRARSRVRSAPGSSSGSVSTISSP